MLSIGKSARASAEEDGHPANYGNDGNESTRWSAPDGTHGHSFLVDLGRSHRLTKGAVLWEFDGVYRYRIEASEDGVTWTLATDKTASTARTRLNEDRLDARGRYVRLTVVDATKYSAGSPENTWDSFYEFTVSGY